MIQLIPQKMNEQIRFNKCYSNFKIIQIQILTKKGSRICFYFMQRCLEFQQKKQLPSMLSIIHMMIFILVEESNYSIFSYFENQKTLIVKDYLSILDELSQIHLYFFLISYFCLTLWGSIQLLIFKRSNSTIKLTLNLTFPIILLLQTNNLYKNYTDQKRINFQFLVQIILLLILQVLFLIIQFSICIRQTSSKNATIVHLNKFYYFLQYSKIHISIILPVFGVNFFVTFLLIFGLSLIKTYLYKKSVIYEQPLHQYIGYIGQIYCYMSLIKILMIYISADTSDYHNDQTYLPGIISAISFLICFFLLIKKKSPVLIILQEKYSKMMKQLSISKFKSLRKNNLNNQNFLIVYFSLIIQQLFPHNSQEILSFSNSFKYQVLECFQKQEQQISKVQRQQQQKLSNNFFNIRNLKQLQNKKKLTLIINSQLKNFKKDLSLSSINIKQSLQSEKENSLLENENENENALKNIQNLINFKSTNQNLFEVQEQMNSSEQILDREGLSLCLVNKIFQQERKQNFISNLMMPQNENNSKQIVNLIWKLIFFNVKKIKDKKIKKQYIYFACYTMSFLKQSPKSKLFQTFYQNFNENMNFCQKIQYEINHKIILQKTGNLPQNSSLYKNTFKNKNSQTKDDGSKFIQFYSSSQVQLMNSFKQFLQHNRLVLEILKSFFQIVQIQQKKLSFFTRKVEENSKIGEFLIKTYQNKKKLREQLQSLKQINQLNPQYIHFSILYDLHIEKWDYSLQSFSQIQENISPNLKQSFLQTFKKIQYKNNIPICIVSALKNKGNIISSNAKFKELFTSDILQNSKQLNINQLLPQIFQKQHQQAINGTFDKCEIQKMIEVHSSNQKCVIVSKVNNFHYDVSFSIHSYLRQMSDYSFLIQFVKLNKLQSFQVKSFETNKVLYYYNQKKEYQNRSRKTLKSISNIQEKKQRRNSSMIIGADLSLIQTIRTKLNIFEKNYKIKKQLKKTDGQVKHSMNSFNTEDKLSLKSVIKTVLFQQRPQEEQNQKKLAYLIYKKLLKNNNSILLSKVWYFVLLLPLFFVSNLLIIQNLDSMQKEMLHGLKQQMNIFKFAQEQYLLTSVYQPIDILMKYQIFNNKYNLTQDQYNNLMNIIDESIDLTNSQLDDLVLQVSSYDPQNTLLFYQNFYPNEKDQQQRKNSTSYYMSIINQKFQFIQQIQVLAGFSSIPLSKHPIVQNLVQNYIKKNIYFLTDMQNQTQYFQHYAKYGQDSLQMHISCILHSVTISIVSLILIYLPIFLVYYKIKKTIYNFLEPIINLTEKQVQNIQINTKKLKHSLQNFYQDINKTYQQQNVQNQTIKIMKTQNFKQIKSQSPKTYRKTIKFCQQSYMSFLLLLSMFTFTFAYAYSITNNVVFVSSEIDTYIQGEEQFVKYLTYSADSFKILASSQYENYSQISKLYLKQVQKIIEFNQLETFKKLISDKSSRQQIIFGSICSQMQLTCTTSQLKKNFNIFMALNQNAGILRFLHSEMWEDHKNIQQVEGQSQKMCLQAYKSTAFVRKIGRTLLQVAHQFTNSKIINFDDSHIIFVSLNVFICVSLAAITMHLYNVFKIYQREVLTFINFKDLRKIQQLNFYINRQIDQDLKQNQFAKVLQY